MSEISTEEKIKEAAKAIFFQKGMAGARMQEIADQAGINKALLHYYYRNKEQLFNAVFEETLRSFIPKLFETLNADLPLEVKVYQVTEKYIDFLSQNREIPLFILNEIQLNPARLAEKMQVNKNRFLVLETQLKQEAEAGNIRPITLEMFMMNILSLIVFPFLSGQLFQVVMNLKDEQFTSYLNKRKKEVPRFIMNALKP